MTTIEDTWNWIYPAIQELKRTTDQPWESRRAAFVDQLGVSNADDDPVVGALLRRLDDLPDAERAAVVDSDQLDTMAYELVQTHVIEPDVASEAGAGYDETAWLEYLAGNGAAWDGTAESWDGFRQWFAYYAADRDLSDPATALLDQLEGLSVAERVAVFAQYGVTIAASAPTDAAFGWVTGEQADVLAGRWGPDWPGPLADDLAARWGADWAANPDEHKVAWLADLIATGAFADGATAESGGQEVDDQQAILADFAQMVRDVPGIEGLSDEEITRIISETIKQAEGERP